MQGESRLLNEVWVGTGSITGFDMTISLPEVKVSPISMLYAIIPRMFSMPYHCRP